MSYKSEEVLYIHFEDALNPSKAGIINKIKGQKEALGKLGYKTHIISFQTKHNLCFNDTRILTIPSRILFFRFFIFNKLKNIISKQDYAFIYIRYFGSDPHFIRFLRKLHRSQIKVFLEFPTYPYDQELIAKNLIEKYIFFIDRHYRNKLSKYVYRAISFTYEGNILNMPTIKLENGISIDAIKLTPRSTELSALHLVGVANVSRWHGYDRVICGLYEYFKRKNIAIKVTFSIVGSGNSINELKELSNKLKLDDHVFFTGPRSGNDLDEVFRKSHLAIGSLGMHRIGLLKGSVLKLGEYLARGFPVIISYDDFSLKGETPFILKIPADESPVNIESLIHFYSTINVPPDKIREYASSHFSWDQKMQKVLSTF